ncbi:hypothetical protein PALB_14650 [Pseudoalteromonas luteoviolacea B = ATCC 29581]|nr:hypothetical protein PALB_14650 [Pseudoalteromonas luteoviolacea B = ATCC 29581]
MSKGNTLFFAVIDYQQINQCFSNMELDTFWRLVTLHEHPTEKSCEVLKKRLSQLEQSELRVFDDLYSRHIKRLWDWQYWGAAYVLCGCNSEYDFLDFCNWLLSRGQTTFERFLAAPDSLPSLCEIPHKDNLPYPYIDELDLVPGLLYEEKFNDELVHFNVAITPVGGKKFKNNKKFLKLTYPELFDKYWFKA